MFAIPANECMYGMYELPSPEALKWKIIIKDRKIGNDDAASTCTVPEDDDEDSAYGSFLDWSSTSRQNSLSTASFQNIIPNDEEVISDPESWDQSPSEDTFSYLDDQSDIDDRKQYGTGKRYNNQDVTSDQMASQTIEGTEGTFQKFVEEGSHVPVRHMSLRSKTSQSDEDSNPLSKLDQQIDEESFTPEIDKEFFMRSVESINSSTQSVDNYYKRSCSMTRKISSRRISRKGSKKNSVASLTGLENTVVILAIYYFSLIQN